MQAVYTKVYIIINLLHRISHTGFLKALGVVIIALIISASSLGMEQPFIESAILMVASLLSTGITPTSGQSYSGCPYTVPPALKGLHIKAKLSHYEVGSGILLHFEMGYVLFKAIRLNVLFRSSCHCDYKPAAVFPAYKGYKLVCIGKVASCTLPALGQVTPEG
jgi:hypothetical protein